jgi:hypothetical protein
MPHGSDEQRLVPRFPLPKEKIKFHFDGTERVFAVRDISVKGLGISLLEYGESLLFPRGFKCEADLKLDMEHLRVKLKVARVSAWSVGFLFETLPIDQQESIQSFVDPLRIGSSLRLIDQNIAPDAFLTGMSAWYHGDSATDLFFWNNARSGVSRVLFCQGSVYWEWREDDGVATGELERLEGDKVLFHKDVTPSPKTRALTRKVLEHADVLDYRLVSFLKDKT